MRNSTAADKADLVRTPSGHQQTRPQLEMEGSAYYPATYIVTVVRK